MIKPKDIKEIICWEKIQDRLITDALGKKLFSSIILSFLCGVIVCFACLFGGEWMKFHSNDTVYKELSTFYVCSILFGGGLALCLAPHTYILFFRKHTVFQWGLSVFLMTLVFGLLGSYLSKYQNEYYFIPASLIGFVLGHYYLWLKASKRMFVGLILILIGGIFFCEGFNGGNAEVIYFGTGVIIMGLVLIGLYGPVIISTIGSLLKNRKQY